MAALCALCVLPARVAADAVADRLLHFPMDLASGQISETVSGHAYDVLGTGLAPVASQGITTGGTALRLNGYSNYINVESISVTGVGGGYTLEAWAAPETFPTMHNDCPGIGGEAMTPFVGNTENGCQLCVGCMGAYSFKYMAAGGWHEVRAQSDRMACYQWNHIVAVVDPAAAKVSLYRNGTKTAEADLEGGAPADWNGRFMIGKGQNDVASGEFILNTFNGALDEIALYKGAHAELAGATVPALGTALDIPATAYTGLQARLRPQFHGMPQKAWTNETHGLIKGDDGKYHLFFQKNGNGCYMARQLWGHLTSRDLLTWTEEKIALFNDQSYDTKGCWSGCLFKDAQLTDGKWNIFYTAVDLSKPYIAQATPVANDLLNWTKPAGNPLITRGADGHVQTDFRDPNMFRADDGTIYMIIGTEDHHTALYKYENGAWAYKGDFYNNSRYGGFWEMPTINKVDGKWVFTTSAPGDDCKLMYWVGTINADGTFNDGANGDAAPRQADLMGQRGYGLLSPSIMQEDGKTIALGIVPDKLSGTFNNQMGWAHNYSLPREWSIDTDNNLIQRPYSGATELRTATAFTLSAADGEALSVNGTKTLGPVRGRMVEILGTWTVGTAKQYGYEVLKNATGSAKIYYDKDTHSVKVDMTSMPRESNDGGDSDYKGIYTATLPEAIAEGGTVKLHVFLDHSILDIFINDRFACSVRLYPTAEDADGVTAFTTNGAATVQSLQAWVLKDDANLPAEKNYDQDGTDPEPDPDEGDDPVGTDPSTGAGIHARSLALLIADDGVAGMTASEKALYDYFVQQCGEENVLTSSDYAKLNDYSCVWVNVDRNISDGYRNLPAPFNADACYNALNTYGAAGGNLYLSGQAVQLVNTEIQGVAASRIPDNLRPHILNSDAAAQATLSGDDHWDINPHTGSGDMSNDPFFAGMTQDHHFAYTTFPVQSAGQKLYDHNTMWNNNYNDHNFSGVEGSANWEKFCNEQHAEILGTWGQCTDFNVFGIVRFLPTTAWKGTVVCNGLAATASWAPITGTNTYAANLQTLAANIIGTMAAPTGEELTVTAAGLATYSSSHALDFSAAQHISAYVAVERNGTVVLQQVQTAAAGEGILLRADTYPNATASTTEVVPFAAENTTATSGNLLVAPDETIAALPSQQDGKVNYILNRIDGATAFYLANNQRVDKGRAYLALPASASAPLRSIGLHWGDATGIETVSSAPCSLLPQPYYALSGRRVSRPVKGVYIQGGKKIVVR